MSNSNSFDNNTMNNNEVKNMNSETVMNLLNKMPEFPGTEDKVNNLPVETHRSLVDVLAK